MKGVLDTLAKVSRQGIIAKFHWGGRDYEEFYSAPDRITVSDNLFREYSCLDYNCGKCCWKVRHWNIFTKDQYTAMVLVDMETDQVPVMINGKTFTFFVEDNRDEICRYLEDGKCAIHPSNPIHCALPLIKFKRVQRANRSLITTHITKEVYTRNRFMQCPVGFKPLTLEGYLETIQVLNRVEEIAKELGLDTIIPEIKNVMETKWIVSRLSP